MKKFYNVQIFSGIIFFLFLFKISHAVTYVNSCMNLDTSGETYVLTSDIDTDQPTCFNITANNVYFDCNDHVIEGIKMTDLHIYWAIRASNVENVTVKNCIIRNWTDGLDLINVNNSNFENLLIENLTWHGIYTVNSRNNGFKIITIRYIWYNNPFIGPTDVCGLYIYESSENNFNALNISEPFKGEPFRFYYSNKTIVSNSVLKCENLRNPLFENTNYNLFYNNIIENCTIFIENGVGTGEIPSHDNIFYNNFFNDTNFSYFLPYVDNFYNAFNTTMKLGERIYTRGNYIGGNVWWKSDGTGYSQTCEDEDFDGFCDIPLNVTNMQPCTPGIDCGNNVDYHPLSDEYLYYSFTLKLPKEYEEHNESNFVCVSNESNTISLISENPLTIQNESTENYIEYKITQNSGEKLFVVTTNGITCDFVKSKLQEIFSKTFLTPLISFAYPMPTEVFITFHKDYIDLISSLHLGKGTYRLLIKNLGSSNGKVRISVDLIS